ncbi:MAG TPA: hypothetical protein VGQ42_15760 [Candidatus Dormibacteraeota bacterium]|nr:hypothetical protein [Candidatus Dormibacteraeota bacterium]
MAPNLAYRLCDEEGIRLAMIVVAEQDGIFAELNYVGSYPLDFTV